MREFSRGEKTVGLVAGISLAALLSSCGSNKPECHFATGDVVRKGEAVWVQMGTLVVAKTGEQMGRARYIHNGQQVAELKGSQASPETFKNTNVAPVNGVVKYVQKGLQTKKGRDMHNLQNNGMCDAGVDKPPAEDAMTMVVNGGIGTKANGYSSYATAYRGHYPLKSLPDALLQKGAVALPLGTTHTPNTAPSVLPHLVQEEQ
jgi:hypothetical protein